jgi:DNA-directed RNA polymerase specialized sigma24 family protein
LVWLLRLTGALTGDPHLAEDLVQEVLLRVHRDWARIGSLDVPEAYV